MFYDFPLLCNALNVTIERLKASKSWCYTVVRWKEDIADNQGKFWCCEYNAKLYETDIATEDNNEIRGWTVCLSVFVLMVEWKWKDLSSCSPTVHSWQETAVDRTILSWSFRPYHTVFVSRWSQHGQAVVKVLGTMGSLNIYSSKTTGETLSANEDSVVRPKAPEQPSNVEFDWIDCFCH